MSRRRPARRIRQKNNSIGGVCRLTYCNPKQIGGILIAKLIVAEKPSVARDIARVLGANQKNGGILEGKNYVVTWALGHLVTLADPEEYDRKYEKWEMATLPMLPKEMKLVVIRQTGRQFSVVKTQLFRKDIGEIIIATDAGREGELVARWILEKAGCHVIYGLVGLKTHSKITLVVRREDTGIRRYVHLATGNYNDSTAKLYTDCGIFTCDERFGEDATAVFNMLSGYSEPKNWNRLIVAPIWMKDRFLKLIEREAEHAKKGMPAMIVAKMNSLCDPKIIAALYHASSCGVQIYLLIRGICCLKVGIPGVSENIHVRSIVGNFLEHSRIFYFHNNGSDEIYMGSADWMPRNLDRRVEIVFPVEDDQIKNEIKHVLDLEFRDNVKAHILQPDGTYEKQDKRGKLLINSQMEFCREATEKAEALKKKEKHENSRVFIPAEPAEDVEE